MIVRRGFGWTKIVIWLIVTSLLILLFHWLVIASMFGMARELDQLTPPFQVSFFVYLSCSVTLVAFSIGFIFSISLTKVLATNENPGSALSYPFTSAYSSSVEMRNSSVVSNKPELYAWS